VCKRRAGRRLLTPAWLAAAAEARRADAEAALRLGLAAAREEAAALRAALDALLASRAEDQERLSQKADAAALRAVQQEAQRAALEALASGARQRQRTEEVSAQLDELRAAQATAQHQHGAQCELARRHEALSAARLLELGACALACRLRKRRMRLTHRSSADAAVASKAERAHTEAALAERPSRAELASRLSAADADCTSRVAQATHACRDDLGAACARLDGAPASAARSATVQAASSRACAPHATAAHAALEGRVAQEAAWVGDALASVREEQGALAADAQAASDDVAAVSALLSELHHAQLGLRHAADTLARQVAQQESWRLDQARAALLLLLCCVRC
jgi:hypothetical protein